MGIEKHVFSPIWACRVLNDAIGRAVYGGSDQVVIDSTFSALGDGPRAILAYREFTRLVHDSGRQLAAQRAAATAPALRPERPAPLANRGDLKAVPGHTGVYTRVMGDGTVTYVAKWPDDTKASGTATKGGFATLEAAVEFRNEQTKQKELAR